MLKSEMFSLVNLYIAYRKAKAEAFYEKTHFHALAFTEYEQNLDANLKNLQSRLLEDRATWPTELGFIGDYAYLPKSVDCSAWDVTDGHFRALDPRQDWKQRFDKSERKLANAALRLVIRPTVNFQIISALWIIVVGHLFDASLDQKTSFGNRLRRSSDSIFDERISTSGVNLSTPGIFTPYISAYRDWRERGLLSIENSLKEGVDILAITMDIEKFYHRASPDFLLKDEFLKSIELKLKENEKKFTQQLLDAIMNWYRSTPDYNDRPEGAIPVGLSASKIIANVLLVDFDRKITKNLNPIYYGRYVDDIFLVLESKDEDCDAQHVTERIAKVLAPLVAVHKKGRNLGSLTLNLPYAKNSELIFAAPKQKIFSLSSAHGLDLIYQIRDQIRQQSSEYRLLPSIPESGTAMASRALLATPNAALQADALRKADVVSVRRLGFSLLLSDIETYALDLSPRSWQSLRKEFYGLIRRHLITPSGFFDYFSYIHRIFGLMLSCGDIKQAKKLIKDLVDISLILKKTTSLGQESQKARFQLCLQQYALALLQAGLQAATLGLENLGRDYLGAIQKLKQLDENVNIPEDIYSLKSLARKVLLSDWGRRPYKEYWFENQLTTDETWPKVPCSMEVKRHLRLDIIRKIQRIATNLKVPYWPALVFPTRPLRIDEIGLVAPAVLSDSKLFRQVIHFFRGAKVTTNHSIGFLNDKGLPINHFIVSGRSRGDVRIAVTSWETSQDQWVAAARGNQDRSLDRYVKFNRLINLILKEQKRPDYIVMPELSIPLRWALRAARKLSTNGISMLAGVEYHHDWKTNKLRNDSLVSLTTYWPGYASNVVVLQSKFEPAHGEEKELQKLLKKKTEIYKPNGAKAKPTIYGHRNFYFSILICSDLTNISNRNYLRGEIDALFALEWNQDTKTFSALVESSANDLHAFVVQANNRCFGDSRIRAPAVHDYARDVVQVKGGVSDYYVLGEIDYERLRAEQRCKEKKPLFKPAPIGYKMSKFRK